MKFIFTISIILAIAAATSWTCDGPCIAGYYLSTNSKRCEVCPLGCASCNYNSKCLTCLDGYFMNPSTNFVILVLLAVRYVSTVLIVKCVADQRISAAVLGVALNALKDV